MKSVITYRLTNDTKDVFLGSVSNQDYLPEFLLLTYLMTW